MPRNSKPWAEIPGIFTRIFIPDFYPGFLLRIFTSDFCPGFKGFFPPPPPWHELLHLPKRPVVKQPADPLPTLAFQLANVSEAFKTVIVEALERDPLVAYRNLSLQLKGLICAPPCMIDQNRPVTLIILDAMDKCEEDGAEEILGNL